ncbi:hypothetical protein EDD21DRAFT_129987 [Dissophora ornata]|nr:hypothetical protein EDD21DRAFT_129987 [Dissophora ornata]
MSAAGTSAGMEQGGGRGGGIEEHVDALDIRSQSTPSADGRPGQHPNLDHESTSLLPAQTAAGTTPSPIGSAEAVAATTEAVATASDEEAEEAARAHKLRHQQHRQSLLTKALLSYISFFRIVQPLASLCAFGTITPVLNYFRTQTIFPTIQATLYLFTATLAACSLFFSLIYLLDVILHKPLFWPFTHRHFRQTSKARIGGDLIVSMVFCGLWFLSMVGLVIDTLWVDCSQLAGLDTVFFKNGQSISKIKNVCHLERATLGLAALSWACWMGVLLVLLYGHFWKRRRVIASRLRQRISRNQPSTASGTAGVSSALSTDASTGLAGGSSISGRNATGVGGTTHHHQQQSSSDRDCQDREGEVGLTGIVCQYDDGQSSRIPTHKRVDAV